VAPWIIVTVIVIVWTIFKMAAVGQRAVEWPGLHKTIAITLYHAKPYTAVWSFQPLGTSTAILAAPGLVTLLIVRLPLPALGRCLLLTLSQSSTGSWIPYQAIHCRIGRAPP
jgi:lactate permease